MFDELKEVTDFKSLNNLKCFLKNQSVWGVFKKNTI